MPLGSIVNPRHHGKLPHSTFCNQGGGCHGYVARRGETAHFECVPTIGPDAYPEELHWLLDAGQLYVHDAFGTLFVRPGR